MIKQSGRGFMIGMWAVILAILAAGSFSVGTERSSGSFQAANAFEMRHRCQEDQEDSPFIYPGTGQIRYKGEYRMYKLPGPALSGPPVPADLAANPFIKPIILEPVYAVAGDQICIADGRGRFYDIQGRLLYEGNWRSGYSGGWGVDYFTDGRVRYEGEHVNGLKQGKGRLFVRENDNVYYLLYQGEFAYECFHGKGIMYSPDGQEVYRGCWYYGEPMQ